MSALRRDDRLLPIYPYEPTTGEARLDNGGGWRRSRSDQGMTNPKTMIWIKSMIRCSEHLKRPVGYF